MDTQSKYRTLRIGTTHECNLKCFFCCSEGHKGKYSIANKSNLYNLITACNKILGISRIKYTGGEPLLFGDLFNTIKATNKDFAGIQQTVVTNGLEENDIARLLNEMPYVEITISVPSLYEQTFIKTQKMNKERANVSYKKMIKTLDVLINSKKPFKVNYVVLQGINDDRKNIKEILEYSNSHFNINLRFLELIKNNVNKVNETYISNRTEFIDMLKNIFDFNIIEVDDNSSRSQIILNNKTCTVKYICAFCDDNCNVCPPEKTSLWMTPEGFIGNCNYNEEKLTKNKIAEWDLKSIEKTIKKFM